MNKSDRRISSEMTHFYESLSSLCTFSVAAGIDVALDPTSQPLLEQIQTINHGRKLDMVIVTPSKISVMEQGSFSLMV